jgi:SAM-dependent methyltransferase
VCSAGTYEKESKNLKLLGDDLLEEIRGKTVIDFGCGEGDDALEMARMGAGKVIGIDIREEVLAKARAKAIGSQEECSFSTSAKELVDIIVSIDAFEHFANPQSILDSMHSLLKPFGKVLISFGPTWYHPLGGHFFSVFPWAHLLFSEKALIRWREDFKSDGATRFSEVGGGLNQMTISRFKKIISQSPFHLISLELVPIRKLRRFHNVVTQEFTTAIVRCRLQKRD